MSAPKTNVVYGVLGDTESAYGTLPSLNVSNHGIQLAEQPEISDDWGFDGARGPNPGSGDTQLRTTPVGRIIKPMAVKWETKGGGAAYSSSVKPRDSHVLLQCGGMTATLDATGGNEKYTYTWTSPVAAPKSAGFEFYCRGTTAGNGEKWPVNGAYLDSLQYDVESGKPGYWSGNIQGRLNAAPSEVSWPAIVYAPTVLVPTSAPLVLSVNSVTSLVIRSLSLKTGRKVQSRFADQNAATGHAGFHPGDRAVQLEFLMEASLFATFNPYSLRELATVFAVTFQTGNTQYNRTKFSLPQCQVMSVAPEVDDQVPLTRVICSAHSSTPILNDSLTVTYD